MTPRNVLVFGGGFQAFGLIKALRAVAGIRVLIADGNEENVARYFADAFFLVPSSKEKQVFVDFAHDLCERESVSAIFAATEHELELLTDLRKVFEIRGRQERNTKPHRLCFRYSLAGTGSRQASLLPVAGERGPALFALL